MDFRRTMKRRDIILGALLWLPFAVGAQGLSNEITVERDIIPEQREATRLGFLPKYTLNQSRIKRIQYSLTGITASVPPTVTVLDPAAYGDTATITPWRGYVSVGLFPLSFNGSVSAGYRILDTKSTHVGAWLQYDGTNYKRAYGKRQYLDLLGEDGKYSLGRNDISLGANVFHEVGENSGFQAQFDYTYSNYKRLGVDAGDINQPEYELTSQGVNRLNLDAGWDSRLESFRYGVRAGLGLFSFSKGVLAPGARQTQWKLGGDFFASINEKSEAGVKVDFSAIGINQSAVYPFNSEQSNRSVVGIDIEPGTSNWLLTMTPSYRYSTEKVIFDAGVRFDITHNAGKAFHVGPDVSLTLRPLSMLSLVLHAGGGEMQKTLSYVFDRWNRTMAPYNFISQESYCATSHIPLTFGATFRYRGPGGIYLDVFGEYAKANDWLMPYRSHYFVTGKQSNLSGAIIGLAWGIKYDVYAEFRAKFSYNPGKENHNYYLWFDRARSVLDASLRLTPIEPLDLNFSYELRWGRTIEDEINQTYSNLGNVSNLKIGVTWRFNDRLSAFVNMENLLNRNYVDLSGLPSQGINGLAGVSYKF